ncbi:SGNH hydrolase-type esterase domain-containing protein [Apodospora peruviana]|uniref:SGNH hydrolase-type esterase domain-containing protein n=1 Tax=Apodospora peruviana TaxID=516989 RepID=A0AAE0LZV9_9PEZI|nr:SGNH hydrolase-type esterase domain-containing protein [Apodospora peruviana]
MALKSIYMVALAAGVALAQDTVDIAAEKLQMQAELSSPDFKPYTRPTGKVTEFITLGDSYTAGTGCNGDKEKVGGDAVRGKRSYPFQMKDDADSWEFINGDDTKPRLTFSAYTGDTSVELITQQLKQGGYKENNWDSARDIPFGHPQLGIMSIGGNDAHLSHILNDCIYRAWQPNDCQTTLNNLQGEIENGSLRDKISLAMYKAVAAGRAAGGAEPREAFQLYVPGYISFFNHDNPECDKVDWHYWTRLGDKVPLTVDLRKKLNHFVDEVNDIIKAAADELSKIGVIFVDGLQEAYNGHRYCEPGHTFQEMTDAETWFWSRYSKTDSDAEDLKGASVEDAEQQLLDFVFPGDGRLVAQVAENSPPWTWPGAEKYPTFDSLLAAINKPEVSTQAATPFNFLRSFHPKGTAYGSHTQLIMGAIADNRASVASVPTPGGKKEFLTRCKDWFMNDHLLVATCTNADGKEIKTQEDMNLCLKWIGPDQLVGTTEKEANLKDRCHDNCFFAQGPLERGILNDLWCVCEEENNPKGFANSASIAIEKLIGIQDDGFMNCEGHISAPSDAQPKKAATKRRARRISSSVMA